DGPGGGEVEVDALVAFGGDPVKRETAAAVLGALGRLGGPAALRFLRGERGLLSGDAHLIEAAIEALGATKDPAAVPALVEILDSGHKELAPAACRALVAGMPEDARVREAVLRLAGHKSSRLRACAVPALGRVAPEGAFLRLVRFLHTDRNPRVRAEAAAALGGLRNKDAVPHLVRASENDQNPLVRSKAQAALEALTESSE
ncbi:MAG: HEAT repeat domain-containing protein, partial [Planctomycetota bacterium]